MELFTVKSQSVSIQLFVGKLPLIDDLPDLFLSETQQNVLRLEICVNNSTNSVEKVQSHKYLPCDFLDQVKRKPFVVISLEHLEQIDPQDLEDHTEMVAIGSFVKEGVEEVEYVTIISIKCFLARLVLFERFNPLWMISKTGHFLQYFNLSWL